MEIPSIMVNENVLTSRKNLRMQMGQKFYLCGKEYYDEVRPINENNYVQFELYARRKSLQMSNDEETTFSERSEFKSNSEFEDDISEFSVCIEKVQNGVIINSGVYLSDEQWNTIIFVKGVYECLVCDKVIKKSIAAHTQNAEHGRALERHKPLAKFKLSITRKIRETYHCAVCNEIFECVHETDHFSSKSHQNNLYLAINKVHITDFTENNDMGNKNNDRHYFDNRNTTNEHSEAYLNQNERVTLGNDSKNNINDGNVNNDVLNGPKMLDIVFTNPFNIIIGLPYLSIHVILKRPYYTDYYCGLCDMIFPEGSVLLHIRTSHHQSAFQRTPFIIAFQNHLIRAIREMLHCGICNITIPPQFIYVHIAEPYHLRLLNVALNYHNNTLNQSINTTSNTFQNLAANGFSSLPIANVENHSQKLTTNESKTTKMNLTKMIADEETILTKGEAIATKNEISKKKSTSKSQSDSTKKKTVESLEVDLNNLEETDLVSVDLVKAIDLEKTGYVKVKNDYYKVTITAFNTLVAIGDGSRYCSLCSLKVFREEIKTHVEDSSHRKNIKGRNFLHPFDGPLFRQVVQNMYHCIFCNVIMSRKEIKNHLSWKHHCEAFTCAKVDSKRLRKNEMKAGKTLITAILGKETICNVKTEPSKVLFKIKFGTEEPKLTKKNKLIMINDKVFEINFDNWNSIGESKGGLKCLICEIEFKNADLPAHLCQDCHLENLFKEFKDEKNLLRQINENKLHCVICNNEVLNTPDIIKQHVGGKRHSLALNKLSIRQNEVIDECEEDVAVQEQ